MMMGHVGEERGVFFPGIWLYHLYIGCFAKVPQAGGVNIFMQGCCTYSYT